MIGTLRRFAGGCVFGLICLALCTTPIWSQDVDAESDSVKACEAVVRDHVKRTYPAADRITWNMPTVTSEESSFGERLRGSGTYSGKSNRRRNLSFDCTFDPFLGQVVKVTWQSSFESGRTWLAVDKTDGMKVTAGGTLEACEKAIDARIRQDRPSYRQFELLEETIVRSVNAGSYVLKGEGRVQGNAGNWTPFGFACTYDGQELDLEFGPVKRKG